VLGNHLRTRKSNGDAFNGCVLFNLRDLARTPRTFVLAERRIFRLPLPLWRAHSSSSPPHPSSSLSPPFPLSLRSLGGPFRHPAISLARARARARREVTRERSRAFRLTLLLPPSTFPFRRLETLTTSALLLLSDYCAAVTAVCRFACIKGDSFSGKYQFLRPAWISAGASARKIARATPVPALPLSFSLSSFHAWRRRGAVLAVVAERELSLCGATVS